MTINGPAPMLLTYFMNAAVDQECEIYIKEHALESKVEALKKPNTTSVVLTVQPIKESCRKAMTVLDCFAWSYW